MKNKLRNKSEGHGASKDRYLITYADLITLLLGLFVILYASSQVDKDKFKEVANAFSKYFKVQPAKVVQGGDGILDGKKSGLPEPALLPTDVKSVEQIASEVSKSLAKYIQAGSVKIRLSGEGLTLILPEKLLFQSGKADVQPEGLGVLDSLSGILKSMSNQITVDGHTDSDPIRTFQYESNWQLSGARAMNVGYKLMQLGAPEANFIIRSFGSQRPVADNAIPAGKSQNRRVEITISAISSQTAATVKKDNLK